MGPSWDSAVETTVDIGGSGYVGLDRDAFAAGGSDGLADGFSSLGLSAIVDCDVGARFGESNPDGLPDTAACGGDQGNAIRKRGHRTL